MKHPFSFIHAADIHLDSPLRGLPAHDPSATGIIRAAPRRAFERLVDAAITHKVAFMIIAGDLYDGSQRDINTALFFGRQIARLNEHAIPVYVLFGNHDFESPVTGQIPRGANLFCFSSDKPETFHIDDLGVSLHGQSFPQRDVTTNLASRYPLPIPGHFNIGVLHTALQGREPHVGYAPCSAIQLRDSGYQYWALGHVHQHEIVLEKPPIVFPGNIQGRDIGETGEKGAILVHVEPNGAVRLERLILDLVRWHRVVVDMTDIEAHEQVASACTAAIAEAIGQSKHLQPGHLHAVRVELKGVSPLHGDLLWRSQDLQGEITVAASTVGEQIWIEEVKLHTQPDAGQTDELSGDIRSLLDQVIENPETLAAIFEEQSALRGQIPSEVYEVLRKEGRIGGSGPDSVAELAKEGVGIVLSRLIEGNR